MWDKNVGGAYKCPNAKNVNLTSNNGDFANYCIFNTAEDASAWCSTDSKCLGYVTNGTQYQTTINPGPSGMNAFFYKKVSQ
jgi:hypothetical protein